MEELIEENKKLKERIKVLEEIINRGSSGNTSVYNDIRAMIVEKVRKEVNLEQLEGWQRKHRKQVQMNRF